LTPARTLAALACAAALSLSARSAFANEPATAGALQGGVGFRYGFELEYGDIVNWWGAGLGAELGYTFSSAVYLGGNFDYFFGEEEEVYDGTIHQSLWQLMAEGGYDLGVAPVFVIRPKLGVGFAKTNFEFCSHTYGCAEDQSMSLLAVAPGVKFMFLTENLGLSADVRYIMALDDETTLNALILSLGIGF
jgi:hypothetical protein